MVPLRERRKLVQFRDRTSMKAICGVLKKNRLMWFGHGKGKTKDWVKNYMYMEVEHGGCKAKREVKEDLVGLLEVVRNDMKGLGLASVDALDHRAWRRKIVGDML